GEVVATQFKHHLPNYGVFDERRYFKPGESLDILRIHGLEVGMVICEDIWQDGGPIAALGAAGVDLVVAPNASPYERNKDDVRLPLVARRARETGAPLAYVNMVGGQDELVFDGDSMVVGADGTLLARAPQFVEHLMLLDLDLPGGVPMTSGDEAGFTVLRRVLSAEPVADYALVHTGRESEVLEIEADLVSVLVEGLREFALMNGQRA